MRWVISRVMPPMCLSLHMISWVMSRIGVSFDLISGVIMSVMCRGLCGVYVVCMWSLVKTAVLSISTLYRCLVYIYRSTSSVSMSLCLPRALSCVCCFHMTLQEKGEYKRVCGWSRESRTSVSLGCFFPQRVPVVHLEYFPRVYLESK